MAPPPPPPPTRKVMVVWLVVSVVLRGIVVTSLVPIGDKPLLRKVQNPMKASSPVRMKIVH